MYRLFGMEVSPYAVKVRALLRYKQVPHQWLPRSKANEPTFRQYAKLPIIPLLVTPEDEGLQDSTPLLALIDERFPQPPLRLDDACADFLASALEEAADEWLIKPMFHYRWNYSADRESAALRIASASVAPGSDPRPFAELIGGVLMSRRDGLGCSEHNGALYESTLDTLADLLEIHLSSRPYLFGKRPTLADLGLGSMFYQLFSDPTPGIRLQDHVRVRAWAERSMDPKTNDDGIEALDALLPTLTPVLALLLAGRYLPWASANADALASEQPQLSVRQGDALLTQPAQKYTGKSWQMLRKHWQGLSPEVRVRVSGILSPEATAHLD